jgi:hypothetical protein
MTGWRRKRWKEKIEGKDRREIEEEREIEGKKRRRE